MFRSVNNDIDSASLQHDLEQLVQWEQKRQLHFNAQKCKVIHIGGDKNSKSHYIMKSVNLRLWEKCAGVQDAPGACKL